MACREHVVMVCVICDCNLWYVDGNSPEGALEIKCGACGATAQVVRCDCGTPELPHNWTLRALRTQ